MELKNYKRTECGLIPNDWTAASMSSIIAKNDGIKIGPFGSQLKKSLLVNQGYKVYGQENVFEKDMGLGDRFLTKEHFERLKTCELKGGDFIISMMGTIGKCLIVPEGIEEGIMDSHLLRLRLNSKLITSDLLLQFFGSKILQNQVKRLSVGGIMEGLSSKIIKQVFVPLPPTIKEQTAIATALSDTDALISSLEKLIAKKRNIKQGAMQELLKPKKGWVLKRVEELAEVKSGKRLPLGKTLLESRTPYPYIRIVDMFNGSVSLSDIKYVPEDVYPSIKNYRIFKDDIYISVAGTLGIVGTIPIELDGANLTENSNRLTEIKCNRDYLLMVMRSDLIQNRIEAERTQGAQPKLALTRIRNFHIPLPPAKEQEQIARILLDIDAEITALEFKFEKYKQLKLGMMQNLLTGKIRLV